VRGLRAWTAARPLWADTAWVALWVAVLVPSSAGDGAVALVWMVLTASPLVLRRRRPVVVFAAVVVLGALAYLVVPGRPFFPVVLILIAVHAVAVRVRGRALWAAVAAVAVSLVVITDTVFVGTSEGPDDDPVPLWGARLLVLAWLAAVVLLGVNTRVRRAYLAQLEERARRLEVERDQNARIAVAAERARIAGEMHDGIAHALTVMITLADGLAAQAAATPPRLVEPATLRAVSATGRQALGETRRMLGLMRADAGQAPEQRVPQPGTGDLDALVAQVRAAGLPVALTREGGLLDLGPGVGLAVYRIVQEALTNILKHAGPGAGATVAVRATGGRVEVEVVDDGHGRGPDAAEPLPTGGGHGLRGMAERAAAYGGSLEAGPLEPSGWRVRAVLDPGPRPATDLPQPLVPAAS
jgi:signal transduction histidine kinase